LSAKSKQRIDMLLVEKGLAESRNAAQAMIMAGEVTAAGQKVTKPGQLVDADSLIEISDRMRYVSRAGDKLASVLAPLSIDFGGKTVLDVGSSTGGFTDVALQNGATKVYCVDVGNNQLAYKLRQDPRIVVMERTDIRDAELPERPGMAVMDVSFISLRKVLGRVVGLIKPGGLIVAMMKPQFEAGKVLADKHKGLILDEAVRQRVIREFEEGIRDGFEIAGQQDSAVAGLHGNRERFYLLRALPIGPK
jgi:23S rRNA (cytidine1920-2'-O)/16S rRNA (cytidine1409-2'-O)-methyltransferase